MPCDTIQYTEIDASKMQADILRKALESMGFTVREAGAGRLTFSNGSLFGTYRPGESITVPEGFNGEELTRRYSTELVKTRATRAGWRVTEKEPGKLHLTRRF